MFFKSAGVNGASVPAAAAAIRAIASIVFFS
jgi:hypothetical protein